MGGDITGILGIIIGISISLGNIHQLIKVIKLKDCRQISIPLYAILVVAGTTWLIHGIFRHNIYLIITHTVCICVNFPALIYYVVKNRSIARKNKKFFR